MTTTTELRQRLDVLEAEISAIRKQLAAPEKQQPIFWAKPDQVVATTAFYELDNVFKSPAFEHYQVAEAWLDAFKVMLELRACDGVEVAHDGSTQFGIYHDCGADLSVRQLIESYKLGCIVPCFGTPQHLKAALDRVGRDGVLRAMKTMGGIYE